MSEFDDLHAPGSMMVTASAWPTLVLPPEDRPGWLASPLAYALHIQGHEPMPTPGDEVRRGAILEEVALNMALERIDEIREEPHTTCETQKIVKHRSLRAAATLDGLVDQSFVIETKVVDGFDYDRHWVGRAPIYPRLQAQCQMACGGYEMAYVAALVLRPKLISIEVFEEPRRDDVIAILENRADAFLETLDRGELPGPDESTSAYYALQKTAIIDPDAAFLLKGEAAIERAERWRQAKLDRLAAEKTEEACRNWFASRMDEAGKVELDDGSLVARKVVTVKAREAKAVPASTYWKWSL